MKIRHHVPVVAGHSTGRSGEQEGCAACGSTYRDRTAYRVEGIMMELCDDAIKCASTYRSGQSPEAYVASLAASG